MVPVGAVVLGVKRSMVVVVVLVVVIDVDGLVVLAVEGDAPTSTS